MPNYFDNKAVTVLINDYLSYKQEDRSTNKKALVLREQILKEVSKIINGIIFVHKFTIWENYDDLFQEAALACLKALDKFNPNYITVDGKTTTAFNYFSLTAKRCLKFFTMRNKRNRDSQPIEENCDDFISDNIQTMDSFTINNFVQQLRALFNNKKYKKFNELINIFEEYLQKMGAFNKRDFFRFCKFYGWSPNLIRKFLKIIKDNKEMFHE